MTETTLPKLRVSKEEAYQKIQAQIERGQQLSERLKNDELDKVGMEANNWSTYNINLLRKLFDTLAPVNEYTKFCYSPLTPEEMGNILNQALHPSSIDQHQLYACRTNMKSSINSLRGIHERLELYDDPPETLQRTSDNEENSGTSPPIFGNDVFIVHGRDETAKHEIARFVEKLDLKPIILDEQPNEGLIAILDKFEREAKKAGFAIVLLTPDDVGALKDQVDDQLKPRARQNVIFELGYFMGKLGRKKVRLLLKGKLENPSDLDGILYVSMNSPKGWQLELGVEMKKAELPVDLNKLA
jgi:predicted nucleotide-binding protein